MFEKILVPYIFSEDEKGIIRANYIISSDWSKAQLKNVKTNLKQYLRYVQNNECCYCRQDLGFDYRLVDIEHIVDKNDHYSFGFEPKNLALSCPACNSCKTNQETLSDPNVWEYPSDSSGFVIIHPYFDRYSDHIDINYPVYRSKSDKGDVTIRYCKLDRLADVENRQKEVMLKKSLINTLLTENLTIGNEDALFYAIKDLIDRDIEQDEDSE